MTSLYQGFFLAPTVVASAIKGAIFAANVYERLTIIFFQTSDPQFGKIFVINQRLNSICEIVFKAALHIL